MTNPYSLPEWRAWVKAIREQPDCDNLRLICAEWLDDHGEHERAEFIRVQCHPRYREACDKPAYPLDDMPDLAVHCTTFANGNEPAGFFRDPCEPCRLRYRGLQIYYRWEKADGVRHTDWPLHFNGLTGQEVRAYDRGFVRLSRGPLSVLVGGEPCRGGCDGTGMTYVFGKDGRRIGGGPGTWSGPTRGGWPVRECRSCHGTGRTPGILRDLMRREPVTEVEVTDREPWIHHSRDDASWWIDDGGEEHWQRAQRSNLPELVYRRLDCHTNTNTDGIAKSYPTPEAARAALSRAVYEHCLTSPDVTFPG